MVEGCLASVGYLAAGTWGLSGGDLIDALKAQYLKALNLAQATCPCALPSPGGAASCTL
jgi:hypothetical protein